jgi:hypothetical protein
VTYIIYGQAAINTPVLAVARDVDNLVVLRLGAWEGSWYTASLAGPPGARERIDRPELRAAFCQRGALRELDNGTGGGGTGGSMGGGGSGGGVSTGGTGAGGAIGSGGTGGIIGSGGSGGSAGASGSTVTASGGSLPADAPPAEVWKVTIDVFSGVPNPVFTLEPSEVAEVQARLDSAPWVRPMASANETIIPARLGYRGMQVRASAGGNVIGDTEISEGTILRSTTGAVYDGKSVNLEGYLLSLAVAKGTISQGLADQIKLQAHGSIP